MFDEILGLPAPPPDHSRPRDPDAAPRGARHRVRPGTAHARRDHLGAGGARAGRPGVGLRGQVERRGAAGEPRFSSVGGELGLRIAEHESFAVPLLLVDRWRSAWSRWGSSTSRAADRFGRPVRLAVSGLTVVLAVVALYYVVRAGHSGATAAWGS